MYSLNNNNLFNSIIEWAGSYAVEKIVTLVASKYGVNLSPAGISFLVFIGSYSVLKKYDASLAMDAWNNSSDGKICIQRISSYGYPVNYYFSWEGNYCSSSPYELWNPTFYKGQYDI